MKIGVGGCSNSSFGWGNPWHFYMGEKLGAKIISSSSSGAGNEMNIEKVKFILDNNDLDFFVYQVTVPSRLVLGTTKGEHEWGLHSSNNFNDSCYYTFNSHHNDSNISRIFKKDYTIDDFILNNVVPSKYNTNYKVFHTLMSINQLCDFYGVKVYFFSWFEDLHMLAEQSNYSHIINKLNVMNGTVEQFINENKLVPIPEDSHFDSDNHKIIYEQFIHPQLEKLI
jgi:hypothetical protein